MAAAKRKFEGPFKVIPDGEKWKVVRVTGYHASLEVIERRYQREMERPARTARPPRPGDRVIGPKTEIQPHDDTYWADQRAQAGKEITRDVDGGKTYPQPQGAYRRSAQLNKKHQEDLEASYEEDQENNTPDEEESEYIPLDHIHSISILRQVLDSSSGYYAVVDPYFDSINWDKAARYDGHRYNGIIETLDREEGEDWNTFYSRVDKRAAELDKEIAE